MTGFALVFATVMAVVADAVPVVLSAALQLTVYEPDWAKFGVPDKITGFVLPLGYSFNLDGSMMYQAFAALFIAQAYNIDLSLTQQITMLLVFALLAGRGCGLVEPKRTAAGERVRRPKTLDDGSFGSS